MKTTKRKRSTKAARAAEAPPVVDAVAAEMPAAAVAETVVEHTTEIRPATAEPMVEVVAEHVEVVAESVVEIAESGDAVAVIETVNAAEPVADVVAESVEVAAEPVADAVAESVELAAEPVTEALAEIVDAAAGSIAEAVAESAVDPTAETVVAETTELTEAAPGLSGPAPAPAGDPIVVLGANCSVKDAAALKVSLCAVANEGTDVTLDVSAVERVDTATMQLLCAFVRDRGGRNQSVSWRGESQALQDAVRLLGVGALIGFESKGVAA